MDKSASLLVHQQVPEFVVSDSPRFIEFMQAYYEYLETFNQPVDRLRDVDETSGDLVAFLRNEFATRFPHSSVDDRKLIKIVRELYKVKGTVNAIDLLFRIFFGEAVTVSEPGKQLLRPSDGKWEQLQSITVVSKFGALPVDQPNLVLQFGNANAITNFFEATKIELVATNTYVIYFRFSAYDFDVDQEIDYYVGANLLWKGRVVPAPTKFEVVDGGNDWKLGQVIRFPGTVSDTILQATQVTPDGVLVDVRPIEWGMFHSDNQTVNVSPYPNKPSNATVDIQSTIVAYDVVNDSYVYDHQITFDDYLDGAEEELIGFSNTFLESSYVGSDYVDRDYVGILALSHRTSGGSTAARLQVNTGVTIEEWIASRANIVCKFGPVTTYVGKYLTEDGQLSNPSVRIQDSYFYQLFSYVIQTTRSVDEYSGILSVVHPAGYKYFNDLLHTEVVLANDFDVSRVISNDRVFLVDLTTIQESPILHLLTSFGHSVNVVDGVPILKLALRASDDDVTATANAPTFGISVGVQSTPIIASTEKPLLSPTVALRTTAATNTSASLYAVKQLEDLTVPLDTVKHGINKNITIGTIPVDDNGSSTSLSNMQYNVEDDYFGEGYVSDELTLTIG